MEGSSWLEVALCLAIGAVGAFAFAAVCYGAGWILAAFGG